MSKRTKRELAQALTELLEEHPLDRITIRDITDACDLTRNTFYYHFHDIYELLTWLFSEQTNAIMSRYAEKEDWQGGLEEALVYLHSHKKMIVHVYRSISNDALFRFVNEIVLRHARGVVAREAANLKGQSFSDAGVELTAEFYTNAIVGAVLSWIRQDMPTEPEILAHRYNEMFRGTVESALLSAERV